MKETPALFSLLLLLGLTGSTFAALAESSTSPEVAGLRCEFLKTPLGIDDAQPALSWTIRDDRRDVVQTAYRVVVASSEELLARDKGDLWDSGEVASAQSHLVTYAGKPLLSRQRCFWKVLVKSRALGDSQPFAVWSQPSWWEMGLLKAEDWQGSWVQSAACQPIDNDTTRLWMRQALVPQELNNPVIKRGPALAERARAEGKRLMDSVLPAPVFRSTFEIPGPVKRARLYLSGLGFAEAFINGVAVSDRLCDPSVNYFQRRGGYVTHDITALVHRGPNVVTALVGSGWWYESVVWGSPDKFMGRPSLRAQVEVELADGKRIVVPTSASWTTAVGPILKSHYYAGEVYDARRAAAWRSGPDDGLTWVDASEVKPPVPVLQAQRCEPERILERVKPVALAQPRPGIWVFDLGRLVMGTVELNLKAAAGTTLVLRTAEWTWQPSRQGPDFRTSLLHYDEGDNTVRTEGMIVGKPRGGTYYSWSFNLQGPEKLRQVHLGVPTLVYVARGDAQGETWRPSFTIHPFRYIEVQGLKEAPSLDLLTGLIISNDEEPIGRFTSGSQRFNAIWDASMNSTRFTTHGMTWDNATERLQSQVYNSWSAPFASYVLWYPNLWRKILEDGRLASEDSPGGELKFSSAIYGSRGKAGPPNMPVTQGTIVELAMAYYDRYGDTRELARQFPFMKTWCEAFFPNRDGKLKSSATMGAWNDHFYREMSEDCDWTPLWDQPTMMSMMLYDYTRQTADAARILKKDADAAELDSLAEKIRAQVNAAWYNRQTKTYCAAKAKNAETVDASTGWHGMMAMAIAKGLAPAGDVPALLDNCVADMKKHYRSHAATGHITHQLLYDVFSDNGLIETCYDMMNATGYPSFAWMLQSGNRTIPEGPTLPSALPAKASAYQNECQEPARWFTQTLCGVAPDRAEPGFKHVWLRPRIPARLPSASLVTTTPYGELESSWKQEAGQVTWTVRIPANSYATAWIPARSADSVQETGRPLAAAGCKMEGQGTEGIQCRLGSGSYTFTFPAPKNAPSRLSELK